MTKTAVELRENIVFKAALPKLTSHVLSKPRHTCSDLIGSIDTRRDGPVKPVQDFLHADGQSWGM